MSTNRPATRAELKAWCLRRLGAPVLEINVADEQLEDLIDVALQYFWQFHGDGSERMMLKTQFTQEMRDAARTTTAVTGTQFSTQNTYIEVPEYILGINDVHTQLSTSNAVPANIFNIKYQIFLNDIYAFTSAQILHYYMVKSYLETLDFITNSAMWKRTRFNVHKRRLYLDINWDEIGIGDYILIDCYRALNPADVTEAWNNLWLKEYTTALFKKQWGQNLTKFNNVQLPGGVTLNGDKIFQDALVEIEKLEEKLRSTYELPPLDLIG